MQFGYTYPSLFNMDLRELAEALDSNKRGLAYRLWKEACLLRIAFGGKDFPATPEEASPELYPPKKKYKMPDFLKERMARKGQNG